MKMKKKYKVIICLLIIILVIIFLKRDRNYEINYKINNYDVYEKYLKKEQTTYIKVLENRRVYEFVFSKKISKKSVNKIDFYQQDKIYCLNIQVKDTKTTPICYQNNEATSINNINNKKIKEHYKITDSKESKIDKIDNISVYDYDNYSYFIWDYQNFKYFSNKRQEIINITQNDVYNLNLVYKFDKYLLIADQTNYDFNTIIVINMKTLKKDVWNLDYQISQDSYFLGDLDKSVYLLDKKSKVEYELVPSHKKMRIVGTANKTAVFYNNNLEEINIQKLVSKEKKFIKEKVYNYKIVDKKLYLSYINSDNMINIDQNENIKIVDQIDETVFYLIDDKLYSFNSKNLKKLLISSNIFTLVSNFLAILVRLSPFCIVYFSNIISLLY